MKMPYYCVVIALAGALLAVSPPASATGETTSIKFLPGHPTQPNGGGQMKVAAVEITGVITSDAPERLRRILEESIKKSNMRHDGGSPLLPVYLNSPGGNVLAAIQMGQIIRELGISTWLRPKSKCASSCVLVFAGGIDRLLFDDAHIGIHRPYFPPEQFAKLDRSEAMRRYATVEEGVAEYLRRMGISDQLFNQMMQIPSNKIRWLIEDEAKQMRLIGQDPGFFEWDRARMKGRYLPEYVEWKDKFDDCVRSRSSDDCLHLHPLTPKPVH